MDTSDGKSRQCVRPIRGSLPVLQAVRDQTRRKRVDGMRRRSREGATSKNDPYELGMGMRVALARRGQRPAKNESRIPWQATGTYTSVT